MSPVDPDTPVLVGPFWVLLTLDGDPAAEDLLFHASIAVGSTDELSGSNLTVTANAGDRDLRLVEGPPDDDQLLPTLHLRGITAFAQYTFHNPERATPVAVTVTIGQASERFMLT